MSHNQMHDPPTSSSEDEVPPKQRKIEPSNIDLGHGEELELDPTTNYSGLEATPTSSNIEANQTAIQQELSNTEESGRSQDLDSVDVEQQPLFSPETMEESSPSLQIQASTAGEALSSASDNNGSNPQSVQGFLELLRRMGNIFDCRILGKVQDLPYPEAVIPPRPALQFYSNAPVEQQQENIGQLKDGVLMKITDRLTNETKYCEFKTMPTSSKIEAEISQIKSWIIKMMTDSSTNNSTTNDSGPEATPTSSKIEANQTGNQQKLSDTEQPGRSEELDSVNVEQQLLSSPGTSGESSSSAQSEASTDGEASSSASDNNRSPPQSVQGGPEQGSGVVDLGDCYVVGILGGIPNQINNVGSAPTVLIPSPPAFQFYSNEAGSLVQQQYWLIQIQNGTIMNTTFLSTNNSTTNYSGVEATPTSSKIEANQTEGLWVMSSFPNPINTEASAPRAVILFPSAPQFNNNEAGSSAQTQSTGPTVEVRGTKYPVAYRDEAIDSGEFWNITDDYTKHSGFLFTCDKCHEKRTRKRTIEDHIWVKHMGGKFKCPFCLTESLKTRDGLRDHVKICPKVTNQAVSDASNNQNE